MNVRLITQISGTRNGADWPIPGTVVDLPDTEARDLIRAGQAVDANDPVAVETGLLRLDRPITTPTVIEGRVTATPAHPTEPLVPVALVEAPSVIEGDELDKAAGFTAEGTTPEGKVRASASAHLDGRATKGPDTTSPTGDPDAPLVPEDATTDVPIPDAGEVATAKPRTTRR